MAIEGRRRPKITKAQTNALLHRQRDICPACGERINRARGDKIEVDHVIPRALFGSDDMQNLEALHKPCHRAKTSVDVSVIAKCKRVARKHSGDFKPRHRLPFGRESRLKQKVGGKIVTRDTGKPVR